MSKFKSDKDIFVLFAHANYQLDIGFKKLNPPQKSFQVYNYNDLMNNIDNLIENISTNILDEIELKLNDI